MNLSKKNFHLTPRRAKRLFRLIQQNKLTFPLSKCKYRFTFLGILDGSSCTARLQKLFPAIKNSWFPPKTKWNKTFFFRSMNFYSKAKRDRQLRNMISTIYSKSRVSKNIFLQIKGILPKEVRAHFQKIEDAKTYLIQKRKIRNSRIKHKLTEVKNPKCLINKITPDSYSRCFGLHSSSFNRLKSVNSINLLPLLVKPYVKEVLVSRYLASPELNLSKLRILLDKQRTISPTLKFSSFSYMKTPELASFIFKRPLLKWFRLLRLYENAPIVPQTEIYLKTAKLKKTAPLHILNFRFNRHRLVITFGDDISRHFHFFVSPGLFLKYFKNKKSLKKSKSMRLLVMRFLRKVLLVLKLKAICLKLRGVPLYFDALITSLLKPLSHVFVDPVTSKLVNELDTKTKRKPAFDINFSSVRLDSTKPFGTQKTRKRGRIKRKIRRKLTRLVHLVD